MIDRKIIHVDMDAFFAAVEQRDNPQLKDKPVIVGGSPDSRGVVATCSYEARKYGIHSAMASSRAGQLCPHAVFVKPRFQAYKEASQKIHQVFQQYTDLIEPLSLDEAYLDVTETSACDGSATLMAKEIRQKIVESTQLTASAGISYNKFLAKVASDINKPNGQYVIKPGEGEAFLDGYPGHQSRTVVVGEPSRELIETYKIHRDIYRATIDHCRPGARASDVYHFANNAFNDAGIEGKVALAGHGVGAWWHQQEPYMVPSGKHNLEKGMVVALEPHIGHWHLQDMVLITDAAPLLLSPLINTDEMLVAG